MFLNPASSSIFNENTTSSSSSFRRSSSSKKNENAAPLGMKTPHNNSKNGSSGGNVVKKSGQTTQQRRRRALGDISNKGGGSAAKGTGKNGSVGGGGNKLVLKPLSTGLRSNNHISSKNRQVKFSRGGTTSGSIKNTRSTTSTKLQQPPKKSSSSSEYDGIFGVTTRWATTDQDHDRPPPYLNSQLLTKDEFELSNTVAEEIRQHRLKERVKKEELEERRMEERLRMKKKDVLDDTAAMTNDVENDLQQLLMDNCNIVEEEEDEQEALWELKTCPAWEEEEGEFDPTEERRLSGTDPVSLWGDILSP